MRVDDALQDALPFRHHVDFDADDLLAQINVPPSRRGALWKVIAAAVRCPGCGSTDSKASTGKRINSEGLPEQYRVCRSCEMRFRLVFE